MNGSRRIRADRLRATESLYGPSRADRPSDLHGSAVCPFCPGNERLTGALLTADPGPHWQSRVIRNLYPAVLEPDGRHEVIVEMRAHDGSWATAGAAELERILRVYRDREAAGYADGHAYVALFKNSGAAAGASLRHPHAQVVALRALPLSIAARIERLTSDCVPCALARRGSSQIVTRNEAFLAYVPDGSRTAFEMRIAPLAHAGRFCGSVDFAPVALAGMLDDLMKRLVVTLGENVPFNIVLQSAPRDPRAEALLHWEIEVIPRLENFGGYELGSGGFLVSRLPESAAALLRSAVPSAHA